MQKLTDIVVIERLPLATCPAHAVFPTRWTLSSSFHVLKAAPHPAKNLQGLSISMAKSPLYKPCISAGNSAVIPFDLMTDMQYTEGNNH